MSINPIPDTVGKFCHRHNLLPRGATVLVAVSGGADSLTLLHVLLQLRDEFGIALHVATVDHRIRIPQGAEDAEFVRMIADQWGLPVTVGTVDVPELAKHSGGRNLEAVARHARYDFLAQTAAAIGATHIATGHNRNDQEETVIMHLLRGAGLSGLRGILPISPLYVDPRLTLIRPLLEIRRTWIDEYVWDIGLIPRHDDTNDDRRYTRNRLRHEVLPLLESIGGAGVLAKTAELIRDDYDALRSMMPPVTVQDSSVSVEHSRFLALPIAIQRMWAREAVIALVPRAEIDFRFTLWLVDLIVQMKKSQRHLIDSVSGSAKGATGGLWLSLTEDVLTLRRGEVAYPESCPQCYTGQVLPIPTIGTYTLSANWTLTVDSTAATYTPTDDPLTVTLAVPPDAEIVIRTRRDGDRFKPLGMGGKSRKVQDMFVDLKVTQHWRDQVPLIVINGEIAGFIAPTETGNKVRVSESFAVRDGANGGVWVFRWKVSRHVEAVKNQPNGD